METSRMVGKPTLMAIFPQRHEASMILDSIGRVGYPVNDVSVYYRVKGTDHVVDATTGQVAAGQSLNRDEITEAMLAQAETVVLLHPPSGVSQAVIGALNSLGDTVPTILYEGETDVAGHLGGYTRQDESGTTQVQSS